MARIRHNPQDLVEKLEKMAEGIRLHVDAWPPGSPSAEELDAVAGTVKKAVQDREKARLDAKKAVAVLIEQTMKGKGSALGKYQLTRAMARLMFPESPGDFGLLEDGIEEAPLKAVVPTGLRIHEIFRTRVVLIWSAQRVRVAYQVFMGRTDVYEDMRMIHSGTQVTATIDGLEPGGKYYFAVRAKGKEEPTLFSQSIEVTTLLS